MDLNAKKVEKKKKRLKTFNREKVLLSPSPHGAGCSLQLHCYLHVIPELDSRWRPTCCEHVIKVTDRKRTHVCCVTPSADAGVCQILTCSDQRVFLFRVSENSLLPKTTILILKYSNLSTVFIQKIMLD